MWTRMLMILLSLAILPIRAFAADPPIRGNVTVLVAASLTELFKRAQAQFENRHPEVKILLEPGASLTLIRKVTDLHREADLIAVADRSLIPAYLIPKHVDQSIDFLTEQIAIVIGPDARHADKINSENWHEILLLPGVEYGISDPESAPVGYRTLMVWKLAEGHYKKPGMYQKLRDKLPQKNIRQNATATLTLLKAGEVDYVFDYPSLARQNGLRAVELPARINLGHPEHADFYKTVSVEIPGSEPGAKKTILGEPIVYSIAPLKAATNPDAAGAFLAFILGAPGRAIMADLGLSPLAVVAAQ